MLVLTGDGKGIVIRPDALRPATAKAAAADTSGRNWRPACHQVKSTGASGWPSWPASTTPHPAPRTPDDIITPPGREKKDRTRGPAAAGKWLTASVTDDIPAVIAAAFDEAERRDPGHCRPWTALVDGNRA